MKTLVLSIILFLIAFAASAQRPVLNRSVRLNDELIRIQTQRARISLARERLLRGSHITPEEKRVIRKESAKRHRIKEKRRNKRLS